jgi:multidrug efflux pump subunit AcrA (membrane-fusion protein)
MKILYFFYLFITSIFYFLNMNTPRGIEMKKSLRKKIIFVIVILLAASVLLLAPSMLAGNTTTPSTETRQASVFSVRTAEAQIQTLYAFLETNGDIVSTQQTDVFPDAAGRLVSVRVALGSYVRKGDLIAEIDPSRPGMEYMNSPVYAPISGYISKTPLSVGMTVSQNTSIATISANGTLEISARIPEREIAGLSVGLKAEVSLQAYPGEAFTATVTRVSPIIDSASRTKLINLSFDPSVSGASHDTRINAGMFARLSINTRTYPNILTIPVETIISSRGVDTVYVVVVDEMGLPTAERREVICGVTLQGKTEIKSGLAEGETVIIQGQQLLSGGENLRIIGVIQ